MQHLLIRNYNNSNCKYAINDYIKKYTNYKDIIYETKKIKTPEKYTTDIFGSNQFFTVNTLISSTA